MTKLTRSLCEPLLELQRRGCVAYIAGGAVRDTICKRPVRDVDVFIHHIHHQNDVLYGTSSARGVRRQSAWDGLNSGDSVDVFIQEVFGYHMHEVAYEYGSNKNPHLYPGVVEGYLNGVKYQFIFTQTHPLVYIKNHFDIDLCRAWTSDGVKLSVETPFINDWLNRTITVAGDLTRPEYTYAKRHHLPRVAAKYPDYKIVIDPALKAKFGT